MVGEGRPVRVGRHEQVPDSRKDRGEPLQASCRSEALHHSLPLSQRHMRVLGPVVQAFVGSVLDPRHDLAPGSPVGGQLIGDDALGHHTLLLHQPDQQALGRLGVAVALDDLVEHVSVLVHSPPQPVPLTSDTDDHLIQMPDVIRAWRLATEAPGILWSELPAPSANVLL